MPVIHRTVRSAPLAGATIDLINPANVGPIEAYRRGQRGPFMYDGSCDAIIILSER